jgi:hypothetical protein
MKQTLGILGALAAPLIVTGCMESRTYQDPTSQGSPFATPITLAVSDGHLQGDIGDLKNLNDKATLTQGETDGASSTYVKVQADKQEGTGMVILNLYGLSLDQLKIGDTQFGAYRSNAPIYALGCSGPNSANIAYDQPADHGTITVASTQEGARQVTVNGQWTEDASGEPLATPTVATGTFTYKP